MPVRACKIHRPLSLQTIMAVSFTGVVVGGDKEECVCRGVSVTAIHRHRLV